MYLRSSSGSFSSSSSPDSLSVANAVSSGMPSDMAAAGNASPRSSYLSKRLLDIVVSGLMLLVFTPHLLFIALVIRLRTGGPSIYAHRRIGLDGQVFPCLKFRTMVPNADGALAALLKQSEDARMQWATHRKLDNDPRIIPGIGQILRRTSLDELPQLLNVLRGEMSLVGPRPVTQEELLAHYQHHRTVYQSVRPGLTGLWQISGRSNTSYRARVDMDCWYACNASLSLDLYILWRTTTYFLSGRLDGAQ